MMDSSVINRPKVLPKPLLLKDYLLDELNSCSSSGFKSFPRRQCCTTTIRFLIEIDLRNNHHQQQQKNKCLDFNKPSPPCFFMGSPSRSALTAFYSIVTAVKRFPFGGADPEKKRLKKFPSLRRSLSMKIMEKSRFWKRKPTHKGIQQWKSFEQLLKEDNFEPSTISNSSPPGEFSDVNLSSEVELNLPYAKNDAVEMPTDDVASTDSTTNSDSANSATTKEKDQFSPVSVLDCRFEEEEDREVSSLFQQNLAHTEGSRKKPVKRIQKPECQFQLEPVNLVERFANLSESSNGSQSPSSHKEIISEREQEEKEEENQVEQKALDLLNHMKDTIPSYGIKVKADKLLLDFFIEQIRDRKWGGYSCHENVVEEAESWINGRVSHKLFLEWNVASHREVYVKDIEKGGEWKTLHRENEEVAWELEGEVFATLLSELLVDHLI